MIHLILNRLVNNLKQSLTTINAIGLRISENNKFVFTHKQNGGLKHIYTVLAILKSQAVVKTRGKKERKH